MGPLSHKVPILAMVALCAAIDAAGIRYVAQNWETLSAYVPHVLLSIGLGGIAWRIRSVLKQA
jgi:hypothetical protein